MIEIILQEFTCLDCLEKFPSFSLAVRLEDKQFACDECFFCEVSEQWEKEQLERAKEVDEKQE